MGKISLVSAKYIVHATIEIKGNVDRPDVIGAIFGQTEGLLGADLELRELQRSGRIGRIEVKVDTKGGVTRGEIIIPSSLDKSETSIVGAALEIIERIGPCESKICVSKIEDVRISKREFVLDRARHLLKKLTDDVLPDSHELADEVAQSIRVMEIVEYGDDRLPAGPMIDESEEIFVVEGRADVLTLLKHGIKNSIAMNGTSVPETIKRLSQKKIVTAFVDGDRGGDLIVKELDELCDIDFVTKAQDGKEVEELTKKEVMNTLRKKKPIADMRDYLSKLDSNGRGNNKRNTNASNNRKKDRSSSNTNKKNDARAKKADNNKADSKSTSKAPADVTITGADKKQFSGILEDLIGSRAAVLLDTSMAMMGKVPIAELHTTVKNLDNIFAIVFDGEADDALVDLAKKKSIKAVVAMNKKVKSTPKNVTIFTPEDL